MKISKAQRRALNHLAMLPPGKAVTNYTIGRATADALRKSGLAESLGGADIRHSRASDFYVAITPAGRAALAAEKVIEQRWSGNGTDT